jgi:rare lipoprotein A
MKKSFVEYPWQSIALSGPLFLLLLVLAAAGKFFSSPTPIEARSQPVISKPPGETGEASYYGAKYQGRATANGEKFDMNQLTAAHPKYPFGTKVKVTNLSNNRSVIVRINDRGPSVKGRIIDLSLAAAEELQMVKSGVAKVKLEVVTPSNPILSTPSREQP